MKASKIAWAVVYLLLSKGAFANDWNGSVSSSWNVSSNWSGGIPTGNASLAFLSTPAPGTYTATYTNAIGGLQIASMSISTSGTARYTIQGNTVGPLYIPLANGCVISIDNTGQNSPQLSYFSTSPSSTTAITSLVSTGTTPTELSFFSGSGGLTLSAANSSFLLSNNSGYSGPVTLSAGTIGIGDSTALGTGTLTVASGTTLKPDSRVTTEYSFNNTIILSEGGSLININIDGSNVPFTLNGAIEESGGAQGLNITGGAEGSGLILTSLESNYSGGTSLNYGTIAVEGVGIESKGPLGTGLLTMVGGRSTGTTTLKANGTATLWNDIFLSKPDSAASPGEEFFNNTIDTNGFTLTLNGVIRSTNEPNLFLNVYSNTFAPGGELILSGDNTFRSPISLLTGKITTKHPNALGQYDFIMSEGTVLNPGGCVLNTAIFLAGNATIDSSDTISEIGSAITPFPLNLVTNLTIAGLPNGQLTLSGNNAYSGVTAITGGTLFISSDSNLGINYQGTRGALNLAGGSLTITSGFSTSRGFAVTESATLTTSAGTTELTGSVYGADGKTLTLVGSNWLSNVVVGSGRFTIAGSLGGTQAFNKLGNGTLVLTGAGNSVGNLYIQAGQLAVMADTTAAITVFPGATLSGLGPIHGAVINNGTVSPGASIGTLTITGAYTQGDNSIYNNEINDVDTDLLAVSGNIVIGNGATFALAPEPGFTYTLGKQYTVMTAGGALSGNHFASITTTNPQVNGLLLYSNNSVQFLTFGGNLLPVSTFPGNSGQVQLAIEEIFLSGNLLKEEVFFTLLELNSAQLDSALDWMHPAMYKGLTVIQENNAFQVRNSVSERFQTLLDTAACLPCAKGEKKLGLTVWSTGFGDFLHQGAAYTSNSPEVAYDASTGGFSIGADRQIGEVFYLGLVGAYTHSAVHWKGNRGQGDINSLYAGVYASAIHSIFYGNFSFLGSWSNFDAQRKIIFPSVNRTASHTHDGSQLITHFDTGLNLSYQGFTLRPFDSLDWILQEEGRYTETGAGHYDLSVNSSSANMLRNELGLNFAYCHCLKKVKTSIDAKLGWVLEERLEGKNITSSFAGTNIPFTVQGYFPTRNLLSVGASLHAIAWQDRLTCTLYYNGAFGDKYSDNGMGAQLSVGF